MAIFTVHQAKTNLSQLLADVEAGKEVVIARGKEPVARLVAIAPVPPLGRRVPGLLKGILGSGDSNLEPWTDEEMGLGPNGRLMR